MNHSGHVEYTATGMPNRKLAIWLFLASECMFFGALIATYLIYQGQSLVGPYPEDLFDIPLTTVSTFILLMSSLAMVLAVAAGAKGGSQTDEAVARGDGSDGPHLLRVSGLRVQPLHPRRPYLKRQPFRQHVLRNDGLSRRHVAIGVIWLSSLFAHTFRPVDPKRRALDIEIAGVYWHFVDIVWIVIFTVVYLLGVGG